MNFEEWLIRNIKYSWHKKYQKYYDEWLSNCPKEIIDGYKNQFETDLKLIK